MSHDELSGALLEWWDEAAHECVWWAPWHRAVEGLTAEQAAWTPAPGRHSIWEIVNHVTFWREYFVHRNEGGTPMGEVELEEASWRAPTDVNEIAWRDACRRFGESHAQVRRLLADPDRPAPPKPPLNPRYLLFHDCYHMGQVMFLRALLGMPPLER